MAKLIYETGPVYETHLKKSLVFPELFLLIFVHISWKFDSIFHPIQAYLSIFYILILMISNWLHLTIA